jgi:signal transduction histidine kinase
MIELPETGHGHGLSNMRRRARQLHGKLEIEALDGGTRMILALPSRLPDFAEETGT